MRLLINFLAQILYSGYGVGSEYVREIVDVTGGAQAGDRFRSQERSANEQKACCEDRSRKRDHVQILQEGLSRRGHTKAAASEAHLCRGGYGSRPGRAHVLIHAEEVRWIMLVLERNQSIIIWSVGSPGNRVSLIG